MENIQHIRSLTSLRGIAAIAVVVLHFSYYTLPRSGEILSTYTGFFKNSYLWVDFFFILSGFIMTHVYLDRFGSGVRFAEYRSYLGSRFARIYPLHLFTLLLLVGLEFSKIYLLDPLAFTSKFNLTALFANLLLLQAFDLNCPPLFWCNTYWNEPAWSVSVEFVIYGIFPFLVVLLAKNNSKLDRITYATALILIFLLIKFTRGNLDAIIGIPSIARCGLECILGIITYKVYRRDNYRQYWNLDLMAIGSITWIVLILHNWTDKLRSLHDWAILPAFSILILAISYKKSGSVAKFVNSPFMLYLGTISYSIYLIHWPIAELLKFSWNYQFPLAFGSSLNQIQAAIALCGFVLITILCASVTYRFIELPVRNFAKSVNWQSS